MPPRAKSSYSILGHSIAITKAIERAIQLAQFDCSVLITGETGTGKELFAHLVHDKSPRSHGPFSVVNCAAINEGTAESELFGHRVGSFTGASSASAGRIAEADGGTLFLDEIGELSPSIQCKLLRVLQDHVVQPVGGKERFVDFRLVVATSRNIEIDETFRKDLYFRVSGAEIALAPLRERLGDIPEIATDIIKRMATKYNVCPKAPVNLQLLQSYNWPGNVRELINIVERYYMTGEQANIVVGEQSLPLPRSLPPGMRLPEYLCQIERTLCQAALDANNGNRVKAAAVLGINRTTLVEKLERGRLAAA